MISEFVDAFMENKDALRAEFEANEPDAYEEIVKQTVKVLKCGYGSPDYESIEYVACGSWQGTFVYVIPDTVMYNGRQWYVRVAYGSCSGCDTLEYIKTMSDKAKRVDDYMTMALHIVQNMREMEGEIV